MAGMTTSPQLRESPETAKFQVPSPFVPVCAGAEVCANAALGNALKISIANSGAKFPIRRFIEPPGVFVRIAMRRARIILSRDSGKWQSRRMFILRRGIHLGMCAHSLTFLTRGEQPGSGHRRFCNF